MHSSTGKDDPKPTITKLLNPNENIGLEIHSFSGPKKAIPS